MARSAGVVAKSKSLPYYSYHPSRDPLRDPHFKLDRYTFSSSAAEEGGPSLDGRRGGVGPVIDFWIEPYLVASPYRARVRSAHARRFAAPLLCQGGEFAIFQFIHTWIDRAYSRQSTGVSTRSVIALFQEGRFAYTHTCRFVLHSLRYLNPHRVEGLRQDSPHEFHDREIEHSPVGIRFRKYPIAVIEEVE